MATMDLSINQELMGVQTRYDVEYKNHVFELQEAFQETDITRNNNFFNPLKTETSDNHACDPNPLYQVHCKKDNEFEVDNSLFSYSSFRKAMDLRIHNRTADGVKRTIFDDADYFARNCCYKLLPITFEQVDETIIYTEHNYSLFSLGSDSESDEDCSRTMDYTQIKEKNYKRRRTKILENSDQEEVVTEVDESCMDDPIPVSSQTADGFSPEPQDKHTFPPSQEHLPFAGQPLDLSAAPPAVQLDKTEVLASIPEDATQLDSDKENAGGELGGIRVTITRPDEKESYQPCDLFLNDMARLVPWLIDKNCFEVDILDRTCDPREDVRKHRLYYVIAESTWQSFQTTNERIILTNDRSLGQPLKRAEREEKPSYLVFDQFSLAKCLAEYCQEIGGCFEYTCVEELKERTLETVEEEKSAIDEWRSAKPEEKKEEAKVMEETEKRETTVEAGKIVSEENVKESEIINEKKKVKEPSEEIAIDRNDALKKSELTAKKPATAKKMKVALPEVKNQAKWDVNEEAKRGSNQLESVKKRKETLSAEKAPKKKVAGEKKRKKKTSGSKRKRKPSTLNQTQTQEQMQKKIQTQKAQKQTQTQRPMQTQRQNQTETQTESKNSQITTRSKSTSEFETSQTSDKRVSRRESRKRREEMMPPQQPPNKRRRTPEPEEVPVRSKRPATVPTEVKATLAPRKKPDKEEKEEKKDDKREKRKQSAEKRSLRLRSKAQERKKKKEKARAKGKEKAEPSRKARKR